MNISRIFTSGVSHYFNNSFNRAVQYTKAAVFGMSLSLAPQSVSAKPIGVVTDSVSIFNKTKYPDCDPIILLSVSEKKLISANNAVKNTSNTARFLKSLADNEKALSKDLKLDNHKLRLYKSVLKRIGMTDGRGVYIEESEAPTVFSKKFSPFKIEQFGNIGFMQKQIKQYERAPFNMERFVISNPSENEKRLLKKYDVDYSDENISPEKLAIGAIIHLSELEKGYQGYLKTMTQLCPDLKNDSIQNSIKNAKILMYDEELFDAAISKLKMRGARFYFLLNKYNNILSKNITNAELNDLRTFASTVKLDKEDYLFATWDGHSVIPEGKNKDRACANILSLFKERQF